VEKVKEIALSVFDIARFRQLHCEL